MRSSQSVLLLAALAAALVAGCGGGARLLQPVPGDPVGGSETVEVGPLVIRTASTAGFTAQNIPDEWGYCSLVALYGAKVNYLASQALLDRIVFTGNRDGGAHDDVWICNLDGSGMTHVTDNGADEAEAAWSRDGTRIALDREWPSQDREIIVIDADGSSPAALTANTADDKDPCWSPDGTALAFASYRDANWEIYSMADDGRSPTNLTSHSARDQFPCWSPDPEQPDILFATNRTGPDDIYTMDEDGSSQTGLTSVTGTERRPVWDAQRENIAYQGDAWQRDIFLMDEMGSYQRQFTHHADDQWSPAWSSDGRWLAFCDDRKGPTHIFLKQTAAPYDTFQVTTGPRNHLSPHLGSPTMQTERVLIGPSGSDWGGLDPIWSSAYAGICAFSHAGYHNFVRIGIAPADAASLQVTPLPEAGRILAAVAVEANQIANLRQDAGRGNDPTVWQFGTPSPGAVVMYFHALTGKLVSVLASRDTAYPSAASAADRIRHRTQGDELIVVGDFSAVFDADGRNLARDGATGVTIAADGALQVIR